ncbi:MAG: hypothetical protein GF355_06330, partial [Candidatus Eisenbacteria bacterium]|nr:hypothetical protein [Candidatus Eisenbacteria bacterium]
MTPPDPHSAPANPPPDKKPAGGSAPQSEGTGEFLLAGSFLRRRWVRWILLTAYVAFIFYLSTRAELARTVELAHADKVAHLVEYAILG